MNCKLFLSILSIGFLTTAFSHADERVTTNIDSPSVASKLSDINRNDLAIASPLGITVGEDSIDVAMQKHPSFEPTLQDWNSEAFGYRPLGYRFYSLSTDLFPTEDANIEEIGVFADSKNIIQEVYIVYDTELISYDEMLSEIKQSYLEHPMTIGRLNNSYAYINNDFSGYSWGYFIGETTQFVGKNVNIDIAEFLSGEIKEDLNNMSSMKQLDGVSMAHLDSEPDWIEDALERKLTVIYSSPSMVSMRNKQYFYTDKIYSNIYQTEKIITDYLSQVGSDNFKLNNLTYHEILTHFVDQQPIPSTDNETIELYKTIVAQTQKDLLLIKTFIMSEKIRAAIPWK
ncbi:hypothetical protein I6E61_00505 [Psychrobacter sp. NZS113]|uniref:hypothetical protein n=1 Tax=Psychrobacter sp. NZS113 TaxID=2792045 RepID=UPI0018CFDA99|nr:hypothetical protein [Psychrobacter sp. NZS113]MBH0094868.1 hypothetical protein [Psychrobacter sp. NZS113]